MIVTAEELKNYSDVVSSDDSMIELMITAAQEIVQNYLGYRIEANDYQDTLDGNGEESINLGVKPIKDVSQLVIDGETMDVSLLVPMKEYLIFPNYIFTAGSLNIKVLFRAGYENNEIPAVMKLTVIRIAALLLSEGSGHIGVSSISDGNTGSRTFMERSFKRYLRELSAYRVSKW